MVRQACGGFTAAAARAAVTLTSGVNTMFLLLPFNEFVLTILAQSLERARCAATIRILPLIAAAALNNTA
jgi:hypothetical protein